MTSKTSNLQAAKTSKNDEFYTQFTDIEREMNAYVSHDPDVFRGKTILLPCDDAEWSGFVRFFALAFEQYGIKKLISTSYNKDGRSKKYTLDRDVNHDGHINIDDMRCEDLNGDGDFRSDEITKLRDEADFVITNPPFSIFREFVTWLIGGDVKFSIVGSTNAITYNETFTLIREGEMWLGNGFRNGKASFRTSKIDDDSPLVHFGNISWFTNIEHGRRHEPLSLMTTEDNLRFNRQVPNDGYLTYDNYDAIEVPFVSAIPSDYDGVMGVPITYLDRHCPEQFEIVGMNTPAHGGGVRTRTYGKQVQVDLNGKRSIVSKLDTRSSIKVTTPPEGKTYYEVDGELFICTYARILIRAIR